jgi:hypothetical protein
MEQPGEGNRNLFSSSPPPWVAGLPKDVLVLETQVVLDGYAAQYDQPAVDALIDTARSIIAASGGLISRAMFVPPGWGDGKTWLLVGAADHIEYGSA